MTMAGQAFHTCAFATNSYKICLIHIIVVITVQKFKNQIDSDTEKASQLS